MKVRAIDFVHIAVPDMKEARQFYEGVLGLTTSAPEGDGWVEYDAGNVTIALSEGGSAGEKSGNAVIGLAVDDIHAAAKELAAKGVTVGEVSEWSPCYMGDFKDPFGNTLYLHERKDGTAG